MGSYDELVKSGTEFTTLLSTSSEGGETDSEKVSSDWKTKPKAFLAKMLQCISLIQIHFWKAFWKATKENCMAYSQTYLCAITSGQVFRVQSTKETYLNYFFNYNAKINLKLQFYKLTEIP